jgi:hypothetical protein
MTSISADGAIGEGQPAALAPTDHGLDCVAQKAARCRAVAQFARAIEIFPGDLEGVLKQLGERDRHARKTNSSRTRSTSSALRRTLELKFLVAKRKSAQEHGKAEALHSVDQSAH